MQIFKRDYIKNHILLVLLFLGSLILRLPTISAPLARDEAISFNRYGHLSFLEILFNYPDSNQHAFFSILSNACLIVFGDHEIAFRLPSLIAGVLAVPLTYCVCRSLGFSLTSSFASSFLLALYVPHIAYSQEGRGYALSVFLGILLILSSIHILRSQLLWLWGVVLVLSATGMVITLPSNAIFVAGAFGFCLILRILKKTEGSKEKGIDSYYWAFYVLSFFLILGYLLINSNDIQVSAEANLRGGIQTSFLGIAEFLVAPWGLWLYLFFIFGFFSNLGKQTRYGFIAIFLLPALVTMVSGVVGFARIYIYLAPFVFMIAAVGFARLYEKSKAIGGIPRLFVLILSIIFFSYQPALTLAEYYPNRLKVGNGYLKDAIKVHEFIQDKPLNLLPVIMNAARETSVLNHYFAKTLKTRMSLFVAGKKIDRILFLCQKGVPPNKYKLLQLFNGVDVTIPEQSVKLIKSFGSFQVFEWVAELSSISSRKNNRDYEKQIATNNIGVVETHTIKNPRAVGQTSLLIKNSALSPISLAFPRKINIDMHDKDGFVLNLFLKSPNQRVFFRTVKIANDGSTFPTAYLNPIYGDFKVGLVDKRWEMVFLLSPIGKGKMMLQDTIQTDEKTAIIDGIQSYIIKLKY